MGGYSIYLLINEISLKNEPNKANHNSRDRIFLFSPYYITLVTRKSLEGIATQLFLRSIVKRSFPLSKYEYRNASGNNTDYLAIAVHHPREIDFILGNVTRSYTYRASNEHISQPYLYVRRSGKLNSIG